ncbi:MAG: hypothetical protein BRD40_02745 [Bacteroidetes bacterium QS_1_65_9]|nr:MAG: hypothetical protein BRD40_02745 [Bacteroidetes bacterium QS_1_65_9]
MLANMSHVCSTVFTRSTCGTYVLYAYALHSCFAYAYEQNGPVPCIRARTYGPASGGVVHLGRLLLKVERWAMMDVVALALIVVLIRLGNVANVELRAGTWFLGAAVLLTLSPFGYGGSTRSTDPSYGFAS